MVRVRWERSYRRILRPFVLLAAILMLSAASVYAAEPEEDAQVEDVQVEDAQIENEQEGDAQVEEGAHAQAEEEQPADPVDLLLSQSAFVGNSISVGLTMYNNHNGKVPLGDSVMLTKESYSFLNDFRSNTNYLPKLNGTPMRAKDALQKSGARYAFICMGTNDLVGNAGAENAFNNFEKYITEIREENPDITVFIESCTPSRPSSNVINAKVLKFNSYVKAYCDDDPDLNYIDITTPMSDGDGFLQAGYASDGSVHLSNSAYAVWADTVRAYIAQYLEMKKEEIRRQYEQEREEARANYEANMKEMEEKKQEAFEEHMAQVRAEEAAEEARRKYELLNVPDPATLYRRLSESLKG